jgi:hypothetical protein
VKLVDKGFDELAFGSAVASAFNGAKAIIVSMDSVGRL